MATAGNFNNDIGLPLTLFRLNATHRLAVVELGMNHPGETDVLGKIAAPTVAVVNNAQREHQEFMATVEAVALEHAIGDSRARRNGYRRIPRRRRLREHLARRGNRQSDHRLRALRRSVEGSGDGASRRHDCRDRHAARTVDGRVACARRTQRAQRACRDGGGARRGRLARCDQARSRSVRAGEGPPAGEARRAAARSKAQPSSTTPTTRTPIRCAPPSTCSLRSRRRACS